MRTLEIDELPEYFKEIVRMAQEEGELVEVTDNGEVIARLIPVPKTPQPGKRDLSTFWKEMDQLAAEISAHWPPNVSAVEAVRDARRDL